MQFDSYQQMPANVQEEVVTRLRGEWVLFLARKMV